MSKIATQSKLNELSGLNIDLNRGGIASQAVANLSKIIVINSYT